ncbi:MAG: hypothetical protein JSR93_08840 [Verrucomicrobia bacterium]|nr:hypothetical protein [Verrucomicrobiota bacterium]
MSASPPRRVDSSPLHTGNKPQPIESGAKRKRVSQEHIDALIIKARADWSEDAKKGLFRKAPPRLSENPTPLN